MGCIHRLCFCCCLVGWLVESEREMAESDCGVQQMDQMLAG